jgi:serine/threonine protein kinase
VVSPGDIVEVLESAAGGLADRFAREALVLSELRPPAIVRYLAHGATDAGTRYLVMEWLDGEDLAARLARTGLTVAETLTLIRRVADALGSAHARGVVPRDLKPSNLFLPDAPR